MSNHDIDAFADYMPVELRHRHDGWTPARQIDFLIALSETACVEDACRAVGMSPASAYALRRRIEAEAFRAAWDSALDYAVGRLADAALSRALHGVARPIFYKGEQVGERRYFDERLTMFMLRLRDPVRFGKWREQGGEFTVGEDSLAQRAEGLTERAAQQAQQQESRCRIFRHLCQFDDHDGGDQATDHDPSADPNFDGNLS